MVTQQSNKQIKQSCREIPTIHHSEIAEIVAYLNSKIGTRYKPTTANTKKHITARLNEGYTVADFRAVIDSKVQEWRGTEYEKYLRPDTLFGAKFESYLNAADSSGNKQGGIAQFLDNPPTD
ncbi:conserved phage C-terminal domain-containing protein [Ruminococcus sp.]|uniref:conserved phage C-terminal domain-containing protein n=1 Tax=Ruminococcus sp. TaxID=41978 RepID=UPI00388E61CC